MAQLVCNTEQGPYTLDLPDYFDTDDVVTKNVISMATKTFGHKVSNEGASAVGSKHTAGTPAYLSALHEWRVAMIEKLKTSLLGTNRGGPRKDAVESKYQDLLLKATKAWLKTNGATWPKAKEEQVVTLKGGHKRTIDQCLAYWATQVGDELKIEAKRQVDAEKAAIEAPETTQVGIDPEALGF